MQDGEEFGPWLGRQLRRNEMSQAELAERLGLTRAAVSAWITGRAQPRAEMVREIASVLGTDIATVHNRTTDAVTARPIQWYHRPAHADGGREFGNAAAFAFDADLAVLARETTQNSLDERLDPEQPVRVRFTLHELTGEHFTTFLDALKWTELEAHYEAASGSRQKVGRVLAEGLREMRETNSLLLLRVDDYNASGLTGPEYEDGRFSAVVRRQLDSHKTNARAGGSYGLGKATLWATSRLGLVLINSTLSESHEGRTARRLVGRLDLPWREVGGAPYAGPAWLGEPDTEKDYEGVSRSWWADENAASTLWLERDSSAPGTSFLIVGAHDAAGDTDSLQDMHDKLNAALSDNFWAAMTSGRSTTALLEASVRTMRNGAVVIPEKRVDPQERHPALVRALKAYFDHETVTEITAVDQVAVAKVPLLVPPLRETGSRGKGLVHEAVLLVTPADDTDQLHSRLVCMRGSRMTVTTRRPRDLGMGVDPFQAVLLAGYATGVDTKDVELAEAFLRASEPPEHDRWDRTEELAATYARGALTRITEFRAAMDTALRGLVGRRPVQEARGPETLRSLFRLDTPSAGAGRRADGHPTVRSIDGEVDASGAWSLRVFLKVPQREDSWQLAPIAKFDVRSGGRPTLDWATLTAVENCRIVDGVVLVDPNVRSATFSGVTATGSHPVDAHMAGVTVDIQKARGTSA
ncbi:helix-turn-helix transcriptional regulator [Streptomyces sp. NBC_01537]|uniref:helix-turn-helix transcriptional regulator n=1 Tax=Streptomyces sp. NBC_01537 TaxID=2903896 RepID=UPI00386D6C02